MAVGLPLSLSLQSEIGLGLRNVGPFAWMALILLSCLSVC